MNTVLNLPNNAPIVLDPKEYTFPFAEKLPDFLLPSFEFPKVKFRAFLRYSCARQFGEVAGLKGQDLILAAFLSLAKPQAVRQPRKRSYYQSNHHGYSWDRLRLPIIQRRTVF